MAKRKLFKYAQLLTFDNIFQPPNRQDADDFFMKGHWHTKFFGNNNPITLELGCGKGEYSIALAAMYPERNFIGMDFKGDRLYAACKSATEANLKNVAFIRNQIQFIERFFIQGEVDEIWITFPDPQLQKPRQRKRLISAEFLYRYKNIVKPNATVHLKTDNIPFFEDTVALLSELNQNIEYITRDVYADAPEDPVLSVKTHYETLFSSKGFRINYLRFRLNLDDHAK